MIRNFARALLLAIILTSSAPVRAQSSAETLARDIYAATGVRGGLVVHLGSGDGRLTAALHANERYIVHGLDESSTNVAAARRHIRSVGDYGAAISVEQLTGDKLPYADNTVNLIVAETTADIASAELIRALTPRGVLYARNGSSWKKTVKPVPTTIDEWTHFMHSPDNNAVAKDTEVGPPHHLQWVGGPKWARGHEVLGTISVAVTAGGRIFYVADEGPTASVNLPSKWMLVARDAFNGVLLWKREIEKWESRFRPFRSGPTHLPRRLVAIEDEVFMTLGFGEPLSVLDAATGETVRAFEGTEGTEEILIENGRLHLVVGDPKDQEAADQAVRRGKPQPPVHKEIVVLDQQTGKEIWRKGDSDTADLFAQTLALSGDRAFFQNTRAVICLNINSGEELWRTPRSASVKRPAWSVPSLVVNDGIVFSADRKAPEKPIDSPDPQRVEWEVTFKGGNAPIGELIAFSAESGEELWRTECQEGYNAPVDVLLADGQLWTGNYVKARDPGITKARDPKTGEVTRTRPSDLEFFTPGMSHARCYRNRATEKFILLGRSGVELVDVKTGKAVANHWVRGTCQLGVIPANGLIYVPPHTCACYVKTKLNGFNALAPRRAAFDPNPLPEPQLAKGPAFGKVELANANYADEWPTYRHDARRSGATDAAIPSSLRPTWSADIGGRLTSVVVAGDKAFVASVHQHTIHALNAADGTPAWTFTAGGRIDSAPTAYNGTVLFGSTDGHVYCLRATDGAIVWKFRGGPEDRRIVVDGALESTWPVHGSVLVMNDLVYFTAGRSSFLDGGMRMYSLKPETGEIVSSNRISGRDPETGEQPKSAVKGFDMDSGLPDVLSSDGEFVFMRDMKFDDQCSRQLEGGNHLFSPTGFLDDSWWHRSYWLWAPEFKSGWGGWHQAGNTYPAGRILSFTDEAIFGFGRNEMTKGNGGQWNNGEFYRLFGATMELKEAAMQQPANAKRRGRGYPKSRVEYLWQERIEPEVRAMVLAGDTLFVAGPHGETHLDLDAWEGKQGISLQAISTSSGKPIAKLPLDELPIFDGMAAAKGRLFLSMKDGSVRCFAE